MLLPSIRCVIKRRVLVNFRVDPDVVIRQLPEGLHSMAHHSTLSVSTILPVAAQAFPLGAGDDLARHSRTM